MEIRYIRRHHQSTCRHHKERNNARQYRSLYRSLRILSAYSKACGKFPRDNLRMDNLRQEGINYPSDAAVVLCGVALRKFRMNRERENVYQSCKSDVCIELTLFSCRKLLLHIFSALYVCIYIIQEHRRTGNTKNEGRICRRCTRDAKQPKGGGFIRHPSGCCYSWGRLWIKLLRGGFFLDGYVVISHPVIEAFAVVDHVKHIIRIRVIDKVNTGRKIVKV